MSTHPVDINLENVSSNDSFEYSIIFLKGTVTCRENVCKTLNCKVLVLTDDETSEFTVQDGRFKCIIDLKLGRNLVNVICDSDLHVGQYSLNLERKPNICDKVLKLLYVVPKGDTGTFQSSGTCLNSAESACKRIVTGVKLLQCMTAERLNELGLGRKTFNLATENGQEICEIFHSQYIKEQFFSWTSEKIWNMTARELLASGVFAQGVKVLAFLSCTEYFRESNEIKGYVACGRGHLAMISSSGLHSWACDLKDVVSCLTSSIPIDSSLFDDSGSRGTLSGCYATTLGAALHEIGHIFDLVHTDFGVMARGFEELDLFFTVGNPQPKHYYTEMMRRCASQEISVRVRAPTKVTSVSFGFRPIGNDKDDRKWDRDGQAYFHRSAAVLLSGHPWFGKRCQLEDKGPIQISGLEVKVPNGIRLIELHTEDDRLVKYWDFTKNPTNIHRYCLSWFDVKDVIQPSLLVQDVTGKIVTHYLNFDASIPSVSQ
ncbi:putative Zinc metalloproteinase [Daphnia magna]|uniref:Putative Zinc metalloproteinase n=1 Tax=Daphnia magna TaxID=35525 RepID=A0A164T2K9_9CRUS|nr:putative Zinc metalloproteinase [Daphnia magna]